MLVPVEQFCNGVSGGPGQNRYDRQTPRDDANREEGMSLRASRRTKRLGGGRGVSDGGDRCASGAVGQVMMIHHCASWE